MQTGEFLFLDKEKLDVFVPDLFEILYSNMRAIAPTGNSYDEDLAIWRSCIVSEMGNEQRQIILMYVNNVLAGWFQYYIDVDGNSLMMEEIQIKQVFQGTGLFSAFYKWLVRQLPNDILYVEAHADKRNYKSQAILEYLGLAKLGENKNGISFCYKGKYADLLRKFSF